MKKIINKPEDIVLEMCQGLVMAHTELSLNSKYKYLYKKQLDNKKVALISGGGSGHEPAHGGFIGKGMIDAAVCGDVFASPSQIQVYQAIKEVANDQGVLLVIKNYSGDMMNFKNAAHLAQEDGIKVDYVKVDDDIAVQDSLYTVGRRGVAGTVFVHKIAGAAAQRGMNLAEVKAVAEKTITNVKSLGFALTSCTVPAKGTPTFTLEDDKMEYGVGIHGEPGIRREDLNTSSELAKKMIDAILKELDIKDEKVALLVNGFGATPLMELYLHNYDVIKELESRNIKVARTFVGNYMTSIDMSGASLSILKLDDELEDLLSDESVTPAFKVSKQENEIEFLDVNKNKQTAENNSKIELNISNANVGAELTLGNIVHMVDSMCESAIKNEVPFCDLDSHAGDGDFGMSIAKGFKQLKVEWNDILSQENLTIASFLHSCSLIIMEYCGGASGPIWGSGFRAAAKSCEGKDTLNLESFANMFQMVVKGIQDTGERSFGRGAVVGDKTLIDALVPYSDTLSQSAKENKNFEEAFDVSCKKAMDGAEETKTFVAHMGRAGTVGERSIGYPDAGAYGLSVILDDVRKSLKFS
ncbi:MAG: dihydroxyacetone kinase subunit DhaK [Lachnospirales bacterium]